MKSMHLLAVWTPLFSFFFLHEFRWKVQFIMPNFSTFSQHHYPHTKYYCIKEISCCTNRNWCKHMQLLQCSAAKQTGQLELSGEHEGAHPTGNQRITSHPHPPFTVRISRVLSLDFWSKTFSCILVFCYYKHFQYPVILPGCHLHFYITSGIPSWGSCFTN